MHFPTVRSQCRENDIHPESSSLCQKSSGLLNTSCVQRLSLLDFPTSDGVRMEMQTRTDLVTFQGATFHLAITHTRDSITHGYSCVQPTLLQTILTQPSTSASRSKNAQTYFLRFCEGRSTFLIAQKKIL